MADWGQDDAVIAPAKTTTPKESWGQDDAVIKVDIRGFGDKEPTVGKDNIVGGIKAGGEAFVRSLPATGGFWAGAGAGTALAAPYALTAAEALTASVVGAPAAPWVAGAIELTGGLAGGLVTSYGVEWATNKLSALVDPEGYASWLQTKKEYPVSTEVGSFAAGFAGSSYKTAAQQAGKWWTTPIAQRGISGVSMGAFDATQQYLQTGEVDLKRAGASAVGGAVLPGANVAGKLASGIGEKIVGAVRPSTKKLVSTVDKDIEPPPPNAAPEQIEAFKTKVKLEQAKRNATAPLVEAAIRNKKTGEIERMGPKHDPVRKEETVDTHTQGFVDERGNFHNRKAAVDQAKRAGQIPEDHVLENPPGEQPGLHSGDLRKAGDERFAITESQPTTIPKSLSQKVISAADGFVMPVEQVAKEGDGAMSPWLMSDGKIIGTGQDHLGFAGNIIDGPMPNGYSDFMNETGAIRASMFVDKTTGDFVVTLHMAEGQKPTKAQLDVLNQIEKERGKPITILAANKDGLVNPEYKPTTIKQLKEQITNKVKTSIETESYPNSDTHPISTDQISLLKDNPWGKTILDKVTATGKSLEDFNAWLVNTLKSTRQVLFDEKHTEVPKELWNQMDKLSPEEWSKKRGYSKEEIDSWNKSQKDVQQGIDEFGLNYDDIAGLVNDPNEHPNYGTMWEKGTHPKQTDLAAKTSPAVAKAFEKVDPRSVPNEEEMIKHATDIHERFGEEEAIKFFEDYQKDLNERSIPVPNNMEQLDDTFHKVKTYETKDLSEMVMWMKGSEKLGVTPQQKEEWFFMLENLRTLPEEVIKSGATAAKIKYWQSLIEGKKELPSDAKKIAASYDQYGREVPGSAEKRIKEWFDILDKGRELSPEAAEWLQPGRDELAALARKIKSMGGDIGEEFVTGQSRIRFRGEKEDSSLKDSITEFFDNNTPMGDRIAEQVDAAMERTVYQTTDGRVIELHNFANDSIVPVKDKKGNVIGTREVKKGTEVYEWKDNNKQLISHSPETLKRGDKIKVKKLPGKVVEPSSGGGESTRRVAEYEPTIIDGNVLEIEKHSPHRYWHDALASQAIARMALRKMARELELVNNLKQSKLFERVGFGPDKPLKDLPKGWVTPASIERIPELRGWHFDPKTAAIIEDFAKVWDSTMWTKATNAIVKNMMLVPVPHMFNEAMHLWNARGFTGWVDPRRQIMFADTARRAWKDVLGQTKFYRDVIVAGGSTLGADPRNNKYFNNLQEEARKQIFSTPEMKRSMGQLAKKLGTTVIDLYNGISNASQKAMWVTRDVMYFQYIHEIMARHEKRTGFKMELADAVKQAERHMPNYRMDSEVLGNRTVAKTLKNPNVSLFSRYHYGMVKSLVNTLKDIDPRNLKTPEGRVHFREGVDSMLAIGVAMAGLYPLMDYVAKQIFGEGAEQRRAGPFHLFKAIEDVAKGEKSPTALIAPIFTFNPFLLLLLELPWGHRLSTGKPIYHPNDSAKNIASDIGQYTLKQVPQVSTVMSATADEQGDTQFLAKLLDIKVETEAERKRKKRSKELAERAKKGRDKRRAEEKYRP